LVAHTGFEPVISSLRGRCPRPLDECATHTYSNKNPRKFTTSEAKSSQVIFTQGLFIKFLESRPRGISPRSIETYDYAVEGFQANLSHPRLFLHTLTAQVATTAA
jgi:hypothetical protein